jgi:hypothetical protein
MACAVDFGELRIEAVKFLADTTVRNGVFCTEGRHVMKAPRLLATVACLVTAAPAVHAAPPETAAHQHDHSAPATQQGTQVDSIMDRAQKAKTPTERSKLMAENMAIMKAHMAEMHGKMSGQMMDGKAMPMPMDAAHMENMHKHMAMMHDMMERLMVQQELMMKPAK